MTKSHNVFTFSKSKLNCKNILIKSFSISLRPLQICKKMGLIFLKCKFLQHFSNVLTSKLNWPIFDNLHIYVLLCNLWDIFASENKYFVLLATHSFTNSRPNGRAYQRGVEVRLRVKKLESSQKFLGYEKEMSLLEAECILLGLHK